MPARGRRDDKEICSLELARSRPSKGQRFVIRVRGLQQDASPIIVTPNWMAGIKR
jgi:hypothetical protein